MCKICEQLNSNNRVFIFEDDNRYLSIRKCNNFYYTLEFDSDFDCFDIKINYCPICGRRLE